MNNRADNLRWATAAENAIDRRRHGRDTIGERHGMAKLSLAQIAEIRARCAAGEHQRPVAAVFGVSQGQVSKIVRRECWVVLS